MAGVRSKTRDVAKSAGKALGKVPPASPNPMTNVILTDLLLRTGGQLMRRAIEHALLQTQYDKTSAKRIINGRTLKQTMISTAVARMATRSVPGAIVVGGGILAKMLYDRSQGQHAARREGEKDVAQQVAAGAKA